jgi:hypothetical protein
MAAARCLIESKKSPISFLGDGGAAMANDFTKLKKLVYVQNKYLIILVT